MPVPPIAYTSGDEERKKDDERPEYPSVRGEPWTRMGCTLVDSVAAVAARVGDLAVGGAFVPYRAGFAVFVRCVEGESGCAGDGDACAVFVADVIEFT